MSEHKQHLDFAAGGHESLVARILRTYTYVAIWIALSGAVIMYNKWLIAIAGFPYPVALTLWHMFFCSTLAIGLVKSGKVSSINMSFDTYIKAIVPIGACYAGTLWVGNAAYLYLSVSFIQMLKALMPVAVFSVGCVFKTNKFNWETMLNMMLVTVGVAIASYGEINFNVVGVMYQMSSIVVESIRLVLVQILLQSRGLKLNPITTLYYVAPCCLGFLLMPFFAIEYSALMNDTNILISPLHMVANATCAFGLNMAVFLLIGKTSALTMNIGGVVKDWMLIGLSVVLFKSVVTKINLIGYLIAFGGVCWYNYQKLQAMKQPPTSPSLVSVRESEGSPLLQAESPDKKGQD